MLNIGGFQKTTLLDFPGKLASTVFLGGCNFRCPFCHNSDLFAPEEVLDEEGVLSAIEKRKNIIDGVAITGGEPTLSDGLPDFMKKIKDMGLLVKLDSNGYKPDTLKSIIEAGLVDYVAMDIKAAPDRYGVVCGVPNLDISRIEKSIDLLMNGSLDFEFRTTVVPGLHEERDFEEIAKWIAGNEKYFLQGYVDSEMVLDGDGFTKPSLEYMEHLQSIMLPLVPNTKIRGVE